MIAVACVEGDRRLTNLMSARPRPVIPSTTDPSATSERRFSGLESPRQSRMRRLLITIGDDALDQWQI